MSPLHAVPAVHATQVVPTVDPGAGRAWRAECGCGWRSSMDWRRTVVEAAADMHRTGAEALS